MKRAKLVEQNLVVGHLRRAVPRVEHQFGVQPSLLRAVGMALLRPTLDLVGEQNEQHILGIKLPLAGHPHPLWQNRQQHAQTERFESMAKLGGHVTGHWSLLGAWCGILRPCG